MFWRTSDERLISTRFKMLSPLVRMVPAQPGRPHLGGGGARETTRSANARSPSGSPSSPRSGASYSLPNRRGLSSCSWSGSMSRRMRLRCGSGPRDLRASLQNSGSTMREERHDEERRDAARRQHLVGESRCAFAAAAVASVSWRWMGARSCRRPSHSRTARWSKRLPGRGAGRGCWRAVNTGPLQSCQLRSKSAVPTSAACCASRSLPPTSLSGSSTAGDCRARAVPQAIPGRVGEAAAGPARGRHWLRIAVQTHKLGLCQRLKQTNSSAVMEARSRNDLGGFKQPS